MTLLKGNPNKRGFYQTYDTLTAPAAGSSIDVHVYAPSTYSLVTTVASIDTNVFVRLQGSMDNINWATITSETITVNGTHQSTGTGAFKYVRPEFISETGGINATVTFGVGVV
jgi:hypothetical protein